MVGDDDAVVVAGALFADVAIQEVGEHELRVALKRIAPAAAAGGLGADDRAFVTGNRKIPVASTRGPPAS